MIHIYNPRDWSSPHLLADKLRALGCEVCSTVNCYHDSDLNPVINYGYRYPRGAKLNAYIVGNKLKELQLLQDAGVAIPMVATSKPSGKGWLARALRHMGGRDLVKGVQRNKVAYWTKRVEVAREFRVHVINGKVVKVGMKVKNNNYEGLPHPWVRSLRYGWRPSYTADVRDFVTQEVRNEAKKAVKALRYDFAAVDLGMTAEGQPIVFEVNSAPGLKPSIAAVYARHFKEMLT